MKKAGVKASEAAALLDRIKILAVQAMFSDDELLEQLVLKGGNAMALVHQVSARASVDLDFSLKQDFGHDVADAEARIHKALTETFRASGHEVFDFRMIEKPRAISEDMRHFWGGYDVEFKLASAEVFAEHRDDVEVLRRRAVNLGLGTKFLIDISRFEYVDDKQPVDFEGYMIYVYSPVMIVCEKLRAICQQMPEYGPIIKRDRAGSARPRDFVDIFVLMDTLKLDLTTDKTVQILKSMFEVKKVPLAFLGKVPEVYEFHRAGFAAVEATVTPGFDLKEFRFYFDYVLALIDKLKPAWDV
ncbi:MAG TPA: nucleotidyl transferase AbiEii/AbiGii toxin family protein [Polaromonas sp.]|uniref:nucleotidyl transferase AbiEii/AbiGii toxin family protein n=1 Tax=Polaromonas sp. TaxID=1869339 RepID=UPI002D3F720D|nr:nucleotidyl transferase AbiEii/AbiGii toxin family protein [Polaromonas sp.]HYW55806.1 nucleotidyl transferase AbiEii/AbiGii toxin family protein [Polaromonas sp.]